MIRILLALGTSATALLLASCCCTGESKAPKLPPAPQFQEIEAAPAPQPPQVHYEK